VGKTTLALELLAQRGTGVRFDLEDPADLARLDDPGLALGDQRGLVVLDEIQRRPELFPVLRVLADRRPRPGRFLVLGSASPDLLRQSSETLAGRISYYTLPGLALREVGMEKLDSLWLRGGFPSSFLARGDRASADWRQSFVRTFVERDLAQLGVRVPSNVLFRFWAMLAHNHGQTWNGSELGRSLGVSDKTARSYLDVLTAALVVTQLRPWFANIGKRHVKSPKTFITDSGLLHSLLRIQDRHDLERHPKVGASWEGFLLGQVTQILRADPQDCYFWATHSGAELDFLWVREGRRWGFEFKRTTVPSLTPSLRAALEHLDLQKLFLVHAGQSTFRLHPRVTAVSASRLLADIRPPTRG
jgi:predicted AAA+ superfamily ATPase